MKIIIGLSFILFLNHQKVISVRNHRLLSICYRIVIDSFKPNFDRPTTVTTVTLSRYRYNCVIIITTTMVIVRLTRRNGTARSRRNTASRDIGIDSVGGDSDSRSLLRTCNCT